MKKIVVLGDGQVWDLKGVDPQNPDAIFEDLFSGRALGERAQRFPKVFEKFKEKDKAEISGVSVSKAFLNKKDKVARETAAALLNEMAFYAARGIRLLSEAGGHKQDWGKKEFSFWKGLKGVIIGGGVSQSKSGTYLVKAIKKHLENLGLNHIEIYKAKFPGKEAGFLGAAANILELSCKEADNKKRACLGIISLDLGRTGIGVGAVVVEPKSGKLIKKNNHPWLFRYSTQTAGMRKIKDYARHKKLGLDLRQKIMGQFSELILGIKTRLENKRIFYAKHISISLPGRPTQDGYIIDSTDYLPFFTKKDSFHFSQALKEQLGKNNCNFAIHLVNDGIAAGLANLIFGLGLENLAVAKFAYLGPGSGLGGCLCEIKETAR